MDQPLRILLIDDNPDDRALAAHELNRNFSGIEIEQAGDSNTLERALSGSGYDLVITDYELKWTDGLQVLTAVKARHPDCPVIMFAGGGDEHTAVTAMKAGFDDYIVKKPVHFARLPVAVRTALNHAAARTVLRTTEGRNQSLFEHVPVGLYRVTPDGQILEANPALVTIAGCPDHETLMTHNAREFFISEKNYRALLTLLETQNTVKNFEGPGRKLDGRHMWIRNSARAVRDRQGRVLYYEGALEDITREKQAVDKLRESDRRLTTLISNLPGYVYRVANDPSYTPQFISEGVVRVTGYAQSEYLVEHTISCGAEIHPDDKDSVWRIVQDALAAKRPYECEYRIHTKSGQLKWVWERGRGIYSQTEELLFLEGFVTDVTERRKSEELLAKSRSLLHATLESTADGILVVDATGKISGYNERLMAMWGLPAEILSTGDDKRAIQFVLDQLKDAEGFLAKVNYLYNHPEMESFDLLEFKDGKFFERYSQPQRIDGKPVGRVWSFRDITARKKNEDMLARFGRILDSSLNEIYVFDSENLRFTQVNQGARQNLGYSMQELKNLTPLDLKPEYTHESFAALIAPLRSGDQEKVLFITKHRRKDGSHYPVEVCLRLSRSESPMVFVAIIQDITERHMATQQMRKLSSAIEQTADIVVITDREGVIEYVNPAFETTTGYSSAEAIGRKPSLIKSGQYDQAFYRDLWGTILRGESYRGVLVNRRKDGGLYHEEISIAPLRDDSGAITHFVSTGKDISERTHAEQALHESEERLRLALDAAHMGTFDWDIPNNRMTWSRWHEELWGFKPGEFGGMYESFSERVHPEDLPGINAEIARCIAAREPFAREFRVVWPDGSTYWIAGLGEFTFNANGQTLRMRGVVVEITERKRAEEALRASSLQLQTLSKRVIEAQEAERRRLAGELHDELGQALTAIKINLQSRGRVTSTSLAELDAENIRIVEDALQQVRRLALALRPSMLDDLGLGSALRWMAGQTAERGGFVAHVSADRPEERHVPEIETACFRIAQEALTNIARHAHAQRVTVELRHEGDALLMTVQDDGRGFDVAEMLKCAMAGGSFGVLGMQERAALTRGRLEIESTPGHGTTVRATFPWRAAGAV